MFPAFNQRKRNILWLVLISSFYCLYVHKDTYLMCDFYSSSLDYRRKLIQLGQNIAILI